MSTQQFWIIIAILATAIALAGIGLFWWWRRRRQPARVIGPIPRYPLVLVHGIFGFDSIGVGSIKQHYFRGVARALEAAGIQVYVPRLPPLGSVPERARLLADFIRHLPEPKVNVIAHSMGGLDARWAIARLGLGDRVASLVTVGTPHRGSPLADLAAERPARWVRDWFARVGTPSAAVEWLTTASAERFNTDVPDDPRVLYACVVCRVPSGLWRRNPLLVASHIYLNKRAGTNDGIVPTSSQQWGTTWVEHDMDHWGQVGWSMSEGSGAGFYERLVTQLAERGL